MEQQLIALLKIDKFREEALNKLAQLKPKAASVPLCTLLLEDTVSNATKIKALQLLIEIEGIAAIPVLEKVISTFDSNNIAADAINYLCSVFKQIALLEAEELTQQLLPFLLNAVQEIRSATIHCLTTLGWRPQHLQQKIQFLAAQNQWQAIADLGPSIALPLIGLLRQKFLHGRAQLVAFLAVCGHEKGLPVVFKNLFDPLFIVHHNFQIDELIPYYAPSLGKVTQAILEAALFVDRVTFSNAQCIEFHYTLDTAIQATRFLKESTDNIAQKALKFVHLKKNVALIAVENKDSSPVYQNIDFKLQFDCLEE